MKVGLIQIDGDLPNLALMKLSTYHKQRGDSITLMIDKTISTRLINFDLIYISCIFEENKDTALNIQKQFNNAVIGGIGVNKSILPSDIEHIMPDYDLYDCDYSIGYTTRGCIRDCEFCKIPKVEGIIRSVADIYEFWDRRHKHIVLFDNNILGSPKHFKKISEQIIKENLSVDFNQGLDIRLLNERNIKILKKLNIKPYLRFAFDSIEIENDVIKGLELLKKYKINWNMWYVLVGFDTTLEQDFHRLNILKKYKQKPYVMRYKTCRDKKIYNDMASWGNQKQFFYSMDFETFVRCTKDRSELDRKIKLPKSQKTL